VSSWAASTDFRIFMQAEKVKALVAQGCGKYSRKDIDNLEAKAKEFGAAGLIWIKMTKDGPQSSVLKAVGETKVSEVWQSLGAKEDDLVVLIAGQAATVNNVLGQLRTHLARQENWVRPSEFRFVWITYFPLFEFDKEENRFVACHHPFTSPMPESIPLLDTAPGNAWAQAYD